MRLTIGRAAPAVGAGPRRAPLTRGIDAVLPSLHPRARGADGPARPPSHLGPLFGELRPAPQARWEVLGGPPSRLVPTRWVRHLPGARSEAADGGVEDGDGACRYESRKGQWDGVTGPEFQVAIVPGGPGLSAGWSLLEVPESVRRNPERDVNYLSSTCPRLASPRLAHRSHAEKAGRRARRALKGRPRETKRGASPVKRSRQKETGKTGVASLSARG